MTPSEYWEGNVYIAEAYRKAYKMKKIIHNENCYLQGLYNFHAFGLALSNMHFDGKKHKATSYLSEPFDFFSDDKAKQAKAEKKAKEEQEKLIAYLNSLKDSWERKEQNHGSKNR
jgi:hypothetical protein